MRYFTEEEEALYKELEKPNLTDEEKEEIIEKLKEEEVRTTNGFTWLT